MFDTSSPLSWGYDAGGWIYRDLGGNANYDPATLVAGGAIPAPKVAGRYGDVRGQRPDVQVRVRRRTPVAPASCRAARRCIDQRFGSGRALLIGVNPFYRAWIDGEERLVGNGILYPTSAPVAPSAPAEVVAAATEPATAPIATSKLPDGQGPA